MVPERHRLGPLQMRVAGHDEIAGFQRPSAQGADELFHLFLHGGAPFFQVKAEVERDLVVPAPRGVQPPARVAEAGGELALHKGVDILGFRVDRELPAFEVRKDPFQALLNFFRFLFLQHAALAEHFRVGHAPFDVLFRHAAVKRNRGIKIVGLLIQLFFESSRPKLQRFPSLPF